MLCPPTPRDYRSNLVKSMLRTTDAMSAFGTKRTFGGGWFYVRFRGQSGHKAWLLGMSANDPKRTVEALRRGKALHPVRPMLVAASPTRPGRRPSPSSHTRSARRGPAERSRSLLDHALRSPCVHAWRRPWGLPHLRILLVLFAIGLLPSSQEDPRP
jgi:hypothetical protein